MEDKVSVVILIDGARADIVDHLIQRGDLPNIGRLSKEGSFNISSTTFPSTTGCAHLPFLTGKFAGECNLPGVRWMEDGSTRSYFTFGKTMNHDIDPNIKLLYDQFPSACIFSPVMKGADYSVNLFGHPISHVFNNWIFFDKLGFKLAKRTLAKKNHRFLFLCLYSIDELGHRNGYLSKVVSRAYSVIDKQIGEFEEFLRKTYSDYQLLIVSDHGLTDTHTHIDLSNIIRSMDISVRNYPFNFNLGQDVFIGESGNSMANIYLKNEMKKRETKLDMISSSMVRTTGIDLVLHRNEGIHIFKNNGEAIIDCKNKKYRYECVKGDPLDCEDYTGEWLTKEKWPDNTFNSQYPDSIVQISQIFNSNRTGDLIITSENGYDLRTIELPEHKASHGSLSREHMLVPVISNKKVQPQRTTDIFDLILDYQKS